MDDAFTLMQHERSVTQFLKKFDNQSDISDSSLLNALGETRKMINRFFVSGSLEYTLPVRMIYIFGHILEKASSIEVIEPDGTSASKDTEEVFAERLLKENNPWEVLYELEIAELFGSKGVSTKLVDEGTIGGPDVIINLDGQEVSIECKRRKPMSMSDGHTIDKNDIVDKITDKLDIGDDSFFIELTGDGPLIEESIDQIVDSAVEAVLQKKDTRCTVEGINYRVLLKDYFTGTREIELDRDELEQLMQFINPDILQAFISPFDHLQMSPGMSIRTMFKFTHRDTTICKQARVFDFTFPNIAENHYKKVFNGTIKRGRDDLSGRSPSVLFVNLPAYEFEDMTRYSIKDHRGSTVSQFERLEQRIGGELNDSSSLNAIILSVSHFDTTPDDPEISHGYIINENYSPRVELSGEFWELFDYTPRLDG